MLSPFDFLKGQDAESINMVHFTIRSFKQNFVLTDKTVALWLTDDNKKVYETFKKELQSGIPLELFSLRDSSTRNAILQYIQSNVSAEAPRRTLAEVLKITNDMLERHEKRMQESVQEDNYPCSCDNTLQQPTEPASQESNSGSSPSAEFEKVDGSDCQQPFPPAEEFPPKDNTSMVYLDAPSEFEQEQNAKQESVPTAKQENNASEAPAEEKEPSPPLRDQSLPSGPTEDYDCNNAHQHLFNQSSRKSTDGNKMGTYVHKSIGAGYDGDKPTPSRPVQINTKASKTKSNSLNILLIGETGAGKTTFVNGFANCLKYSTFDDAISCDPIIVVRTGFSTVLEKDEPPVDIDIDPEYSPEGYINEQFAIKGQSRTQNAIIYKFPMKIHGEDLEVRLIDTPGVNDTRGANQDLINFYNTAHKIEELGEIHAICILLKPNEARITKGLQSTMDSLLSRLSKAVANNIVFCFTHTEPFAFRPGESLTSLETYLNRLKVTLGVEIPLTKQNMFCVDNNSFRFQCTVKDHKGHLSKRETYRESWVNNRHQMKKMIDYVQTLNPQLISESADIIRVDKCFQDLIDTFIVITKEHTSKLFSLRAYLSKPLDLYPDKEHRELKKREEAFAYILLVCASFTEFLQRRSINMPDYYGIQLQRLIAKEVEMLPCTKSSQTSLLDELNRIANYYAKTLSGLRLSPTKNECGSATPEEIEKIVRKMRSMKMYGDRIPSVEIFPKNGS